MQRLDQIAAFPKPKAKAKAKAKCKARAKAKAKGKGRGKGRGRGRGLGKEKASPKVKAKAKATASKSASSKTGKGERTKGTKPKSSGSVGGGLCDGQEKAAKTKATFARRNCPSTEPAKSWHMAVRETFELLIHNNVKHPGKHEDWFKESVAYQ